MYYSSGNYEAFSHPKKPEGVDGKSAYIIGSGLAALTAACYLVRDGQMKGEHIHIFEKDPVAGGACDGRKMDVGYVMRGGREMDNHFEVMWDLLHDIPSLEHEGQSVLDEYYWLNKEDPNSSLCRATVNRGEDAHTDGKFAISDKGAMEIMRLFFTPDEQLQDKRITDFFDDEVFSSNFWLYWRTMFAFENWHSALEMKLYIKRYIHHIGGLPDVIRAFAVKTLYSPVDEFEGKPFEAMKRAADAKNVRITVPQAGQRFSLGRAEVEFYAPLGIYDDVNDLSLVTRITYGQTAFLFTGDAERPSENDMIDSDEALSATVLKVGHHGSNTSSSYLFLRQVMPSYAVISCGRDNAYGHPHQEVLARLRDIGAAVYRTDESGTIVCRSNGERVAFETEKGKKPTATPRKGQSVGYIGNIKSKKFHLSTCSSVQDIQQSNRITFATRAAGVFAL